MSGKIYRLEQDKIIAGVCAGLADYFEIDPTLVRIVWLLSIFTCFGIIAYLVCWLIIPVKKPSCPFPEERNTVDKENNKNVLGVILILVGLIFILDKLFKSFDLHITIPVLIIISGFYILFRARGRKKY